MGWVSGRLPSSKPAGDGDGLGTHSGPAGAVEDLSAKSKSSQPKDWRRAPRFLTLPCSPAQAAHGAARPGLHHDLRLPWELAAHGDPLQGRRQHQVLIKLHQRRVHNRLPHLHAQGQQRAQRAGEGAGQGP